MMHPMGHRSNSIVVVLFFIGLLFIGLLTGCVMTPQDPGPGQSEAGGSATPAITPPAKASPEGTGASSAQEKPVTEIRLTDGKPVKTAIRECWALNTQVSVYWFDTVKPGNIDSALVSVTVDGKPADVAEVRLDQYGLAATLVNRTWHGQQIRISLEAEIDTEKNGKADPVKEVEAVNRNSPPWHTQALIGPELADGTKLQSIGGLAMARDETFFVTDPKAGAVFHLDRQGNVLHAWKAESPEGVAVLLSGQVYVTCAPKHNIGVFTPEGKLLYTIGRALKGNETPEAFINASNFTEGRNMGGFIKPFRLSGNPEGVQMTVLDHNCFVQMYMEPLDNPSTDPGDRMQYNFDAGNLMEAGPLLGEDAAGANAVFAMEQGTWLLKESSGLLKTISVVDLKTTQQGSPLPEGLPGMASFQPTDICRNGEYAAVADAGNHRILSFKAGSGQDLAIFGNEGSGAEQFQHPAFVRSFGNTVVVADDDALTLHVFERTPVSLSMSCVEPYHLTSTAADPYLMFDEKNAKAEEKGVVYAEHEYPTLSDSTIQADAAFKEGRIVIEDLKPGTRYYARAYARVDGKAVYSYQAGFTTAP